MAQKIFFSKKDNSFYSDELRSDYQLAGTWPDDAELISERFYNHLIEGQSSGKIITQNSYGQPILSNPPPPTIEQVELEVGIKKTALMKEVSESISPLQDALDLGLATEEEKARLSSLKKYRVLLNRVDVSDPVWPETI